MRELGYVEGRNLKIEWRFAHGKYEAFPALAAELVRLDVEVIVSQGTPGTKAAQAATRSIPIVFPSLSDPIGSGIVSNLAKPTGNTTGLTDSNLALAPKQLQVLKTLNPSLSRVAILINPSNPAHPNVLKDVQSAAGNVGLRVTPSRVASVTEVDSAFEAIARQKIVAIIVPADGFLIGQARHIADLARKRHVASLFGDREGAYAGGLLSYGQNLVEQYKQAATYVDKILKGAKPADLPIEQPTQIELVINKRTAKELGMVIPNEILLRADKVIE